MAAAFPLTPEQRARERSILFALLADSVIGAALTAVGLLGGSLTIIAECVRLWLIWAIGLFALVVMRRIHRGILADMEFGAGKLEQIANLSIAAGMLVGAVWIAAGALEIVAGVREGASPFGLAMAAIVASVNTCINIVAWDGMRRTARGGRSVIMQAQLKSRTGRVLSSLFVQAMLTVAAVTRDPVVAGWADAAGSVFVAGLIAVNAVQMIRSGLPDLLDRTVEDEVQTAINRALARLSTIMTAWTGSARGAPGTSCSSRLPSASTPG